MLAHPSLDQLRLKLGGMAEAILELCGALGGIGASLIRAAVQACRTPRSTALGEGTANGMDTPATIMYARVGIGGFRRVAQIRGSQPLASTLTRASLPCSLKADAA